MADTAGGRGPGDVQLSTGNQRDNIRLVIPVLHRVSNRRGHRR